MALPRAGAPTPVREDLGAIWRSAATVVTLQSVSPAPPTDNEVPLLVDLSHKLGAALGPSTCATLSLRARSGLLLYDGALAQAHGGAVVKLVELDPLQGRALIVGAHTSADVRLPWLVHRAIPEALVLLWGAVPRPADVATLASPSIGALTSLEEMAQAVPQIRSTGVLIAGDKSLLWARTPQALLHRLGIGTGD